MKPIVIYIAGYGRSGSSALSRAMAQADGVLSAGELGRLPKFILNDGICSCGEPVSKCQVWSRARTGTINDAMASVTQANFPIVVDSSKTAYLDFHRPLLYRLYGYKVLIVHLKRPLLGVIDSTRKGTNKDIESGIHKLRALNLTRTIIGYTFAHITAAAYRLIIRDFISVEQTEMRQDILKVVETITDFVDDTITREATENMPPPKTNGMHEIAGNRLLRSNSYA